MLRLSRLADYAVVVLIQLSRQNGVMTSVALAAQTGIPEPTVAKVLKALQGSSLVVSQRGARGGYRQSVSLDLIPVSRVITAIDGPIAITACTDGGEGFCQSERACPIRGRWDPVNDAVRSALERITLAELDRSPAGLVPDGKDVSAPMGGRTGVGVERAPSA